jgi:uncharacterized protein YjiS (DUF1127 family)
MREYALHQARSRAAYGQWSWLVRMAKNWQARRTVRHLLRFNDYMLRDIGLTRSDLQEMLRQPLSADRQWDAERAELIASRNERQV